MTAGPRTTVAELQAQFPRRRAGTPPDTVLADVEGLLWASNDVPVSGAVWPLVDAIAEPWRAGQPLTWVETLPIVETQTLEKAPLVGTTVKINAAMTPATTRAAWTNISRQVAASPTALRGVLGLLEASVRSDVDRVVGTRLTAFSAGTAADLAGALALIAAWPGPRLIVLAPAATSGMTDLMQLADVSGGALRVVFDPYLPQSFVVATIAVAVGVEGPIRLVADKPSHLGFDVSESAFLAVEGAAGSVATFGRTGSSSVLDEVFIGPEDPYTTNANSTTELWLDEDA